MMLTTEENIKTIKRIISECFADNEIILFGSRARSDNSPDSDYDLMVIIPDKMDYSEKIEFSCKITALLAKEKISADVLVENRDEINKKKFYIGSVVREALKEGIRI